MARSIYTKLTGRRRGITGYSQLWLAPDHLLLLTSTRITEQYKRFAFSDIQALAVTETPEPVVLQVMVALASLACIGLSFTVDSKFAKWSLAIAGALALAWAVVDKARGPRCRCYLHTQVSRELLTPVSRMTTAREFLGKVRPMVEAVQGVLPAERFSAPPEDWEPSPPEIVSAPGYLPEILFGTFIANAVLIWVSGRFPAQETTGILINTMFAELVLIPVVLLRRKGWDARLLTYAIVAVAILGVGMDALTVGRGIFGWYMTVLDKAKTGDKSVVTLSIFPAGARETTIAWSWRAAAGVAGLAAAFYERWTGPR